MNYQSWKGEAPCLLDCSIIGLEGGLPAGAQDLSCMVLQWLDRRKTRRVEKAVLKLHPPTPRLWLFSEVVPLIWAVKLAVKEG